MRPFLLARAGVLAMLLSACVHPRDFRDPRQRLTPQTAYAEQARLRVDVDLLAPDPQKFGINAGLTVAAIRGRLDFSVNLAHALIGVASVNSKFTLVDSRWYGLGGRVGLTYLNPQTFYFLPRDLRRELGAFHLTSVPLELWHSVPVNRWFAAHLGMGYRGAGIAGEYVGDELFVDLNLAQRSFTFTPVLDFFIADRVALRFAAQLPVYSKFIEATDASLELQPAVRLGLRSVEWIARPLARTVQLEFGAETRFGANTHLRVGINVWAFRPLPVAVTPSLSFYWRFG